LHFSVGRKYFHFFANYEQHIVSMKLNLWCFSVAYEESSRVASGLAFVSKDLGLNLGVEQQGVSHQLGLGV
jgi:hypothetical protein